MVKGSIRPSFFHWHLGRSSMRRTRQFCRKKMQLPKSSAGGENLGDPEGFCRRCILLKTTSLACLSCQVRLACLQTIRVTIVHLAAAQGSATKRAGIDKSAGQMGEQYLIMYSTYSNCVMAGCCWISGTWEGKHCFDGSCKSWEGIASQPTFLIARWWELAVALYSCLSLTPSKNI